jgi:hypothetical protein
MEAKMTRSLAAAFLSTLAVAGLASAQTEDALRAYFEGRYVRVNLDLPASHKGVDLRFDREVPFDESEHTHRLRDYDVAIGEGQRVRVTHLKVKDDLIEFHLAGGGFNWSSDTTTRTFTSTSKSTRERDLEKEVKRETDRDRKRRLQDQLDDLRHDRERHDDYLREEVEAYNVGARERDHERALRMGSRFNLRFKKSVPPDALSPEGVMRYLAPWVDFDVASGQRRGQEAPASGETGDDVRSWLHKGVLRREVEARLGRPDREEACRGGDHDCVALVYANGGEETEMVFVEDVLVRFTLRDARDPR